MPSSMLHQAIIRWHRASLLRLCLDLIVQTFSRWPNQIGSLLSTSAPASRLESSPTSYPNLRVNLCTRQVEVNNLVINVEAYRLEFSFPDLEMRSPLVYYCPRQILAPGYVCRTLKESLNEELVAWILEKPRVNSLMLEHAQNLQLKMRRLISALPDDAFVLSLPPGALSGPRINVSFGSSQIFLSNPYTIKITITTDDGYSISYSCSRTTVPSPVTLRTGLLRLYRNAN